MNNKKKCEERNKEPNYSNNARMKRQNLYEIIFKKNTEVWRVREKETARHTLRTNVLWPLFIYTGVTFIFQHYFDTVTYFVPIFNEMRSATATKITPPTTTPAAAAAPAQNDKKAA